MHSANIIYKSFLCKMSKFNNETFIVQLELIPYKHQRTICLAVPLRSIGTFSINEKKRVERSFFLFYKSTLM